MTQAASAKVRMEDALRRADEALEQAKAALMEHVMRHKDNFTWGKA